MITRHLTGIAALAGLMLAGCGTAQRMGVGDMGNGLAGPSSISWDSDASAHRGEVGRRYTYQCPGGGSARSVWGTGVYSDDSSICTAAVHAGAIGFGGGRVVIEIRPGQSSYSASERNGVSSGEWGAWDGSFAVVN
jgi:hypothetical protein